MRTGAADTAAPAAPELSEGQRRHLRGLAHGLRPLIRVGHPGLTESLVRETVRALHDHELIKVKTPAGDRAARGALLEELSARDREHPACSGLATSPSCIVRAHFAAHPDPGRLSQAHHHDLVGARAARGGHVHHLALRLADQRPRDGKVTETRPARISASSSPTTW